MITIFARIGSQWHHRRLEVGYQPQVPSNGRQSRAHESTPGGAQAREAIPSGRNILHTAPAPAADDNKIAIINL